jgi:ketosteroid isomerase-like protein
MTALDTDRHANLARDFLISRARGDYDSAVALLADDAVWHSPVEGPRHGPAAIREMLVAADRDTDCFSSVVEDIEVRGEAAIATVVNRGERGDRELDSRQWLGFRFRGGRIAEISIDVDDPEAVERFWAS